MESTYISVLTLNHRIRSDAQGHAQGQLKKVKKKQHVFMHKFSKQMQMEKMYR